MIAVTCIDGLRVWEKNVRIWFNVIIDFGVKHYHFRITEEKHFEFIIFSKTFSARQLRVVNILKYSYNWTDGSIQRKFQVHIQNPKLACKGKQIAAFLISLSSRQHVEVRGCHCDLERCSESPTVPNILVL